jgi:putative sigma-54 modulation protein
MELEVTGRHVEVTPALREFTREKVAKLGKWIDDPMEVHAILTVEKHRHIAELVVHSRDFKCTARALTVDMYTAIGECVDKLERQAKKHKEKFATRRRRSISKRSSAPIAAAAATTTPAAPKSRRSAPRRAAPTGDNGTPRIVKTNIVPRKPMSVEEAALQVKEYGLEFFVFRNERSQELNVLYVLKDGSLGLIEP